MSYTVKCKCCNAFYINEGPSGLLLTCLMNFIMTALKNTTAKIPSHFRPP